MPLCDFNNRAMICPVCGYRARKLPTHRECKPVARPEWQPVLVGDLVEKALTSIGITKERVERWTRTTGKPGGCGCKQRQKWLNEKGVQVQKAIRDAARRVYAM